MIKKFAYFKICVYLCTHKTFTIFTVFFHIFLFQIYFQNSFAKNILNKSNFENTVQILRMIFKRMLKMFFEKKVQSKKRNKRNLFLFLYYFSTLLLNLIFPFQRVILHIPQPLPLIIYIIKI